MIIDRKQFLELLQDQEDLGIHPEQNVMDALEHAYLEHRVIRYGGKTRDEYYTPFQGFNGSYASYEEYSKEIIKRK